MADSASADIIESAGAPACRDRVASLLEAFWLHARQVLLRSLAASTHPEVAALLVEHGFDLARLGESPIGLFEDGPTMRRGLEEAGFSAQEIEASAFVADERLAGRLVGPIRDVQGRILSFWARDPANRSPRFLFKGDWRDKTPLVGLDVALRASGRQNTTPTNLVVFERLFDALLLQSHGFAASAAIAGPAKDLTRPRWERLHALGVARVTLVPDATEAAWLRMRSAVRNALHARPGPAVDVLMPEAFEGHRTAGELIRARGLSALVSALEDRAVHGYAFEALAILQQHRPDTGWTEPARHAAWKEAIEFCARSDPRAQAELDAQFIPTIVAGLGRTWDTFEPTEPSPTRPEPRDPPLPCSPATACPATPSAPPQPARMGDEVPPVARPTHRDQVGRPERNGPNGFCRLHGCDKMVCFCFD